MNPPLPPDFRQLKLAAMLAGREAPDSVGLAAELNQTCECISVDRQALARELKTNEAGANFRDLIGEDHAHLFSGSTVFVGGDDIARMAEIIAAVERVVALPAYREHALAYAPAIARFEPAAHSVFQGYDFHLGAPVGGPGLRGPQLIEINTNAGGGLLNAILGRAQQACCEPVKAMLPGVAGERSLEAMFVDMFRQEWQLGRGEVPLRTVAIVDTEPAGQYLYPEFVLFQHLFQRAGMRALICDPAELDYRGGRLSHAGQPIDLVYNRLTDFAFEQPQSAALREAYLARAAVVTPHPRAHALYADKRNLIALSDMGLLASLGADVATRETLASGIPPVEAVRPELADTLWARRKHLFFKPAAGFGGRAAYRGDKLTRGVFAQIVAGDYVAQRLVAPSARRLAVEGEPVELKLDLRNYVYDGAVQLVAARLYRGQTTNFRTPGGGFAPVLTVPGVTVTQSPR